MENRLNLRSKNLIWIKVNEITRFTLINTYQKKCYDFNDVLTKHTYVHTYI